MFKVSKVLKIKEMKEGVHNNLNLWITREIDGFVGKVGIERL